MINPSAPGWIDKFFAEQSQLPQPFPESAIDFYTQTRATGFIYGHIISFDVTFPIETTNRLPQEISKIGMLNTLYQMFRLVKKNNKDRKWVKIVSKYEGECCVCYNKILTDTEVLWNKGNKKIKHLLCKFKPKITKKIINKKQRKEQYKKFSLEQRRKSKISTENNGLPIVPISLSIEEKEWIKSWKENHEK